MTETPLPGVGDDIQDADEVPDPPNDEVIDQDEPDDDTADQAQTEQPN